MLTPAKPIKLILGIIAFGAIALSTHAALRRIQAGDPLKDPGNWPGFNRSLDSQRFSPLTEINTKNVGNLKIKCTFDLGESVNFQTGPVVVDGTMYLITPFPNYVYALDLTKPGAPTKWVFKRKLRADNTIDKYRARWVARGALASA